MKVFLLLDNLLDPPIPLHFFLSHSLFPSTMADFSSSHCFTLSPSSSLLELLPVIYLNYSFIFLNLVLIPLSLQQCYPSSDFYSLSASPSPRIYLLLHLSISRPTPAFPPIHSVPSHGTLNAQTPFSNGLGLASWERGTSHVPHPHLGSALTAPAAGQRRARG